MLGNWLMNPASHDAGPAGAMSHFGVPAGVAGQTSFQQDKSQGDQGTGVQKKQCVPADDDDEEEAIETTVLVSLHLVSVLKSLIDVCRRPASGEPSQ